MVGSRLDEGLFVDETQHRDAPIDMFDGILIHFGEIALKGGNRPYFEKRLVSNINFALKDLGVPHAQRASGRIFLPLSKDTDVEPILERLAPLPGIIWFAPVLIRPQTVEDARSAVRILARRDERKGTFRIETKRADKRFPLTSVELSCILGADVVEETGRPVDLKNPETTFGVRVTDRGIYLHAARIEGIGGLPAGSAARLFSLVSGGIDSPVATWRLMRRGASCFILHFHSRVVGDTVSMEKVEDVCRVLVKTAGKLTSIVVPFEGLQREIIANVPAEWRMIVYRRAMFRVANALAPAYRVRGFVTGDSVSQVASQTLENLAAIYDAAKLPVYTPLAGDDKTDIVAQARRIGTFEISTRPHTDCCSFMIAAHPCTRAKMSDVLRFEADCDFEPLVEEAAAGAEKRVW
jgi:tRNA uracil 4-sulfurtransferase